ncbi:sulfur carrier protein [Breznakibacter xylanolyticus]|uniref:Sulfur carrier protein n=1 Tax=Breznakibacter xylanolyticus TaxID=990 RepID=A0A2W7NJA8_9BACT|nr:sulfur carrier protein ThiS [Breznakibacter xylanolyticus]MBN2742752.1 sulfur carrier protein ThiS [Marinilabiliaceae bacterium]PZX19523.1 sulfur carrier protein [Breznakibacter xylanolyticus]
MRLIINQQESHTQVATLAELIAQRNIPMQGIAVAVNAQIVPRQQWDSHLLAENDNIMVISATRGG